MVHSIRPQDAARWDAWCEDWDAVEVEVQTLFHTRWMWRSISGLIDAGMAGRQDVYVQDYLVRTYAATVCTAIRREVDSDSRTSSLARCLQILIDSPHLATRAWYAEQARTQAITAGVVARDLELADGFDKFAPDGGDYADSRIAQDALSHLLRAAAPIRKYTNKVLAHRDRTGRLQDLTPSWVEIDHALDAVGKTMQEFYSLRHPNSSLVQVTPIAPLTFVDMFKEPWWTEDWTPPSDADPWGPDADSSTGPASVS